MIGRSKLTICFRRFLTDKRAVSAVEFAMLLPIFLILFAATLDLGEALMIKRRIDQVASTTGDIVAQEASWTSASLAILVSGTTSILEPFSSSDLKLRVNVVNINSAKQGIVAWSYGYNTTALVDGASSPITIPTSIAEAGVQMVVVTADYKLTTAFTSLLSSITGVDSYSFSASQIVRPRIGDSVVLR